MLTEEQKIEIGRMLLEGVSDEGIRVVVESWHLSEGTYLQAYQYLQELHRNVTTPSTDAYLQRLSKPIEEVEQ